MTRYLKSPSGNIHQAPEGFSFTILFFGFFVPLFRGDFKWALIMLFLGSIIHSSTGNGSFLINLPLAFMYNELYYKSLIKKNCMLIRTVY